MKRYVTKRPLASFLILLVVGLSLAAFLPRVPAAHADSSTPAGVIIPLYTYPTDGSWSAVVQAKQAYPSVPVIAVINPDNGPGSAFDSNYAQGIVSLQAAGVKVFGYVYTSYAFRTATSVEADAAAYSGWYHVSGIFLDEMSNDPSTAAYYSGITDYVQSLGMPTTIGNAGMTIPTSEIGSVSIVCVSESQELPSLGYITYPGYSPSNFLVIGYGQASLDAGFLEQASSYASWFYLTDGSGSNPYGALSSYFTSEVAVLASLDTASVTVSSATVSGGLLGGMWTTWNGPGGSLSSGFTPDALAGTAGSSVDVSVSNYGNYVFCYWQDGNTDPTRTVTFSGETALTAYYSTTGWCPPPTTEVSVQTYSTSGVQFNGMWLTVRSDGSVVAAGFSPLEFTAQVGSTYTVTASNWGSYVFQSWSWGGTDPSLTMYPTQPTTVFAYYSING